MIGEEKTKEAKAKASGALTFIVNKIEDIKENVESNEQKARDLCDQIEDVIYAAEEAEESIDTVKVYSNDIKESARDIEREMEDMALDIGEPK